MLSLFGPHPNRHKTGSPSFSSQFIPESGFSVSGDFTHGGSITITGPGGFGTKVQAAPVLWDFGNDVWVNGVNNTHHSTFTDGQAVPTDLSGTPTSAETGAMWRVSSFSAMAGAGPEFIVGDSDRPWRHNRITHHYRIDQYRWFGFNWAFNTDRQIGPAWTTGKFYCAGRYRLGAKLKRHHFARYTNLSGTFQAGSQDGFADGELCVLTLTGRADQDCWITFLDTGAAKVYCQHDIAWSSSNYPGSILGTISGATLDLPDNTGEGGLASSKPARIGQQAATVPTETGMRITDSAGLVQTFAIVKDGGTEVYRTADLTPADYKDPAPSLHPLWLLKEWYMDCSNEVDGSTLDVWNNHATVGFDNTWGLDENVPVEKQDVNRTDNPMMFISGLDATVDSHIAIDYGEIYADFTPQRVMVGDANTRAACTNMEFFRPTSWADNSIGCVINLGEFASVSGLELYVFDVDNVPTIIGHWL